VTRDPVRTVVLDVDGTLVDSNYHHALAWSRAFAVHGIDVACWRVHRAIGMGGDKLVGTIAGDAVEERCGDALRDRWAEEFASMVTEIRPTDGAAELLRALADRGLTVALASSGQPEHVTHYVELLGAQDLTDVVTSSGDVQQTKPNPELVQVALDRAGGGPAVMVGDSVWDCRAGRRAGLAVVGVRTGGFGEAELLEAGAAMVGESPRWVLDELDRVLSARP